MREADVLADLLRVVRVEREGDGEPLVDEPGAKGGAEEVEGDQHSFIVSDLGRLLHEECGVALKRRVEKCVLLSPSCGV